MRSKRFSAPPKKVDDKAETVARIKEHLENPKANPTNKDIYGLLLDIAKTLEGSAK